MKQSLQLKLGQHLAMTPQLQQAIRLLQLSTMELQTEVQDALDSNLMLELEDEAEAGAPPASNGAERAEDSTGAQEADVAPVDIPSELPVDTQWDDIYEAAAGPAAASGSGAEGGEMEIQRAATGSLHNHLEEQLNLVRLSETDRAIAHAIIDAVDDDGYLGASLEELHESLKLGNDAWELELDEVQAVLRQVQQLDPPGVAARDLAECLCIQLRQLAPDTPLRDAALELAGEHLDVLGARDFNQLMRLMRMDSDRLQEVVGLIQTLHPRPGALVASGEPEYVIPDVYVRKRSGVWQVELNPEAFPRLRVNSHYASLIRRADNSADNNTLKTHLQEARWFIKSLKSRSETLLKVATAIVQRQQGFLEHGEEAMKPMVLHDIAEVVEMHESTISRVTTNKYMHTPRGVFELKYFFSSHVYMKSGAECSSTAIRALLKKLIGSENPTKPLSDSKLAAILSDQGINVARRTVAKYRESMAIPSSTERKALG
jgi:RNA polymerase sigma-54 factor